MPKINLTRDEARDALDEAVFDEITDHSRWSVHHRFVFQRDGKLYMGTYSVGATEAQSESPFDYEDAFSFTEVEAYEKTITDYRPVPEPVTAQEVPY